MDKTDAQGLTLDEAKTINKSLLTLSNVISALAEGVSPFALLLSALLWVGGGGGGGGSCNSYEPPAGVA